jgi:hypothetical protein
LVSAREEVQAKLEKLDRKVLGGTGGGELSSIRLELEMSESLLKEVNKQLKERFPAASQFFAPTTVTIAALQKRLKSDEALVLTLSDDSGTNVWVVSSSLIKFIRPKIDKNELSRLVRNIRKYCSQQGLDICNGNQIDDRKRFDNKQCSLYSICDRKRLHKAE